MPQVRTRLISRRVLENESQKDTRTRRLRAILPVLFLCPALWAQGPAPTLVVSGSGSTSTDISGSYYGYHHTTPFVIDADHSSVPPAENFTIGGSFGGSAATIHIQGNTAFGRSDSSGCPYSPCTYNYSAGATLNISLRGTPGTDYAIDITRSASISATTASPLGIYDARADSSSVTTTSGPPSSSFSTVSTIRGNGTITTAISLSAAADFALAYLSVTYPGGGAATVDYSVNVVARVISPSSPSLSCPASSRGMVNTPYASAFSAFGGTGTFTSYGIATGSLPPGLSLNSGGGVSGTPTTAGTFLFTGTVADSSGGTGSSPTCSITVAPQPVTLSCPTSSGMVNTPYASAFSAFGGTGTFTFYGIATGSLPPGLSLNSAGGVSGTPTMAGTFPFTGSVADSHGAMATSSACSIIVAPPQCTFSLSYSSRNFSKDGGPASVDVTASDISCPVYSSSPVDWVLISSPQPRYGSGTVSFTVSSNSGAKRQTNITVANQALLISQDGNMCSGASDITPLSVLDYKQCGNPFQTQWWDEPYDSNGGNICGPGCLLTAYADVLSYYGYGFNPSTLNTKLKQLGVQGYTSSGDIVWGSISIVTGGAFHVQSVFTSDEVDAQLCNGRPVILDIGGHFVVATGKVGGLYTIHDPGTVQPSGPIGSFLSGRALVP